MKKKIFTAIALFIGATMMFSCQKADEPVLDNGQATETRAFGDKTPILVTYVEVNDTNPLNAGDYTLPNGKALVDVVEFFAANIRKRTVGGVVEPTLYFNDKMTNLFENGGAQKYVQGLQAKGIKVLVTILGDHQGIGLSSMNSTQAMQFAKILARVVEKYNLDGIGFDDEYADDYGSTNPTSYSEIIINLRALLPAGKMISVFDWGGTYNINAQARACIDYAYPGVFAASTFMSPGIGLTNAKWSPMALNLGSSYASSLSTIYSNASKAKAQGYGAMMCFNLRSKSSMNPLNIFQSIAGGAGFGTPVTCSDGGRAQDWTFVPSGFYTTMDDVK